MPKFVYVWGSFDYPKFQCDIVSSVLHKNWNKNWLVVGQNNLNESGSIFWYETIDIKNAKNGARMKNLWFLQRLTVYSLSTIKPKIY